MSDWPHAPAHKLDAQGTYIVTAATLYKRHHFRSDQHLTQLQNELFRNARQYGWMLQAWAVFSNHYHFVGVSPNNPDNLPQMIRDFHAGTAEQVNALDKTPGRQVWHNYWDTQITNQRSYLARLKYVHQNPVKHGLAEAATQYRWCSASWFEKHASPAFQKTVDSFKIDRVKVLDEFEPL